MAADVPRRLVVTPRQVRFAKLVLKADAVLGRPVDPTLLKIADARRVRKDQRTGAEHSA
ncbi:hypothetical protein [Georgenia yuyongxinii]